MNEIERGILLSIAVCVTLVVVFWVMDVKFVSGFGYAMVVHYLMEFRIERQRRKEVQEEMRRAIKS